MSVLLPYSNWKKQFLSAIIIFFLGALFQYYSYCNDCLADYRSIASTLVPSGLLWVILWKGSEFWVNLLDRYSVSWVEAPIVRLTYSILSVLGYTIFGYYLVIMFTTVILLGQDVVPSFQSINFSDVITVMYVTIGINVIMHGRGFLLLWRQNSIDNEKLKVEHISSQLSSLRDQVNPHFLFNSLNALSSLVYDDQDKAVKFIRKLSDVYRYVLDQNDKELVTVADELKFMESYFYLLNIRFGDNLLINVKIESGPLAKYIPPMSLQLLVENAIKHNVVSQAKKLTIDIFVNADGFLVTRNNASPKKALHSNGIGLKNLKLRYQFLSDRHFIINSTTSNFEVYLPLLELK
ncbi:MAG: sensor histidine kinase YesM [Cyclobacteriaceae bacterium]|jgi:sensor histidine kinase YesM